MLKSKINVFKLAHTAGSMYFVYTVCRTDMERFANVVTVKLREHNVKCSPL